MLKKDKFLDMIDSGFYFLDNGSIGVVYYYARLDQKMSQEKRESLLNQSMAKNVHKMIHDRVFNPDAAVDPSQVYHVARDDTNKKLDQHLKRTERFSTIVQVDQKESYDDILRIESIPNFGGWEDPQFVQKFKEHYLNSVKT